MDKELIAMKEQEIDLGSLKVLELHDQSLMNLAFDFSSNRIKMQVQVFKEEIKDYEILELVFVDVEQVKSTDFNFDSLSPIEIYSHEVVTQAGAKPMLNLTFLEGFAKPSCSLEFRFSSCFKVDIA
jgi:hypothetical protein